MTTNQTPQADKAKQLLHKLKILQGTDILLSAEEYKLLQTLKSTMNRRILREHGIKKAPVRHYDPINRT